MMQVNSSSVNGKRGELRTESILIDRFTILKRSEDYDGVDFLVQPRGSDNDRSPWFMTNMAVVQSKFIESNNPIKIRKSYIHDERVGDRDPKVETTCFFVMVFSGDIDNEQIYMLSADNIRDLWERDGKIVGRTSVNKVTLLKDCYIISLRRIILAVKENKKILLRNGSESYIKQHCYERIEDTLYFKSIFRTMINGDVLLIETGDNNFDKDFKDLREKAADLYQHIWASLYETFGYLLDKPKQLLIGYTGPNQGQLEGLKHIESIMQKSFTKISNEHLLFNSKRDQLFVDLNAFIQKYH